MANKYTQIQTSEYVPQYVPAPVDQIGSMLADARDRRETSQLGDARLEASYRDALGDAGSPEDLEFVKAAGDQIMSRIQERAQRGYSQQDLIRTRLDGEEMGAALGSLQQAKQQRSEWAQQMRELNQDRITDPQELEFWIQNMLPEVDYDMENLRARVSSTTPTQLAKDVNYSERADDYIKGIKGRDFVDDQGNPLIRRGINPETGQVEIQTPSGVGRERVLEALDKAFAADPEIQAQRQRRISYLTAQSEQDPQGTLSSILEASPDAARPSVIRRIQSLREMGRDDAEIAGTLLADNEIRNAQGFGADKYAYTAFNTRFMNPSRAELHDKADQLNTIAASTGVFANPYVGNMPTSIAISTMSPEDAERHASLQTDYIRNMTPHSTQKQRRAAQEAWKEMQKIEEQYNLFPEDRSIETLASSEEVTKEYGEMVQRLVDAHPRQPGESEQNYRRRINDEYEKRREFFASERGTYYMYNDQASRETATENVIGGRVSGIMGSIQQSVIYEMTAGRDSEGMTIENLAEDVIGEKYDADFMDKLIKNAVVTGEFKGNDATVPSGYIVSVRDPGNWFKDAETREFKVASPDLNEQAVYEPLRQITAFKTDPRRYSKTLEVDGRKFELFAEDSYIDGEGNAISLPISPDDEGATFDGKKIGVYHEGERIYEDDPSFQAFKQGIENRRKN